ncbi:DNA-methyltransferase [Paucibacter soli]|uniref:DNA-methyltransferase n=1 Tax=Paucibacter soli TaxID=3133433 RepID=UPI0030AD48BF
MMLADPNEANLAARSYAEQEVLQLLAGHTYEQVREITGWSRGRIYQAACRQGARKTEERIRQRAAAREQMQADFLSEILGTTAHMDVLDFLDGLPDDTVDLFLTSPPYNLGKKYGNSGVDAMRFSRFYGWLVMCLSEMSRVMKPGGTLCLNLGQTRDWTEQLYPMDVMLFEDLRRMGLIYQTRVVWTFKHGLTPKKRLSERYETILVFSKGPQQTFNANAARVPQMNPGKRAYKGPNRGQLSGHPLGAAPSNVWDDIPQVKANHAEKTDHPCQFPVPLVKRAILLYTNAGALVCDPFSGSGSTHEGCILTGRGFVGADLFYEDTRRKRLAKVMPELVSLLPGVTDQSVAVWQAEARRVDLAANPISDEAELAMLCE